MQAVINYGVKPPVASRINYRMLTIVGVFALLVGMPTYSAVKARLNGGIETVGDKKIVDLKTLGYFSFDEWHDSIDSVPKKFRDLDGKQVVLDGFMWSALQSTGKLCDFQFVYNIQKCCYGGPPLVQERVFAHVSKHDATEYTNDYCRITGIMHVKVNRDETGKCVTLYTMDVKRVEPL